MMMMFDEMGYGDLDFLCAPSHVEMAVPAPQTEPEVIVDDDYTDEEIDVDELERRMWRDKMRLQRLKEQNKSKEGVDAAKQRQSQEQARRRKMMSWAQVEETRLKSSQSSWNQSHLQFQTIQSFHKFRIQTPNSKSRNSKKKNEG